MLKSLFTQLMNRKKSNLWIAMELLLVFCVLWYLVDYFFVVTYNKSIPSYQDTNNTYQVRITQFPEDHPEYNDEEGKPENVEAHYARILNHIRSYPGITDVSVSFENAAPGNDGISTNSFISVADTNQMHGMRILLINPETDFFNVFGYTTGNGEKKVSTHDFEWEKPDAVVINQLAASQFFPEGNAIGKYLKESNHPDNTYEIVGIVDNIKRFGIDYPEAICYKKRPIDASTISDAEISVRIDPTTTGGNYLSTFKQDMENSLRIGNFYFLHINSYNENIYNLNEAYGYNTAERVRFYLMIFFLINVLLCVIGTFWYRVNIRREEIGLRMALGSSRKSISTLLMVEGLCLLAIITLPALFLEWQFVHADLIPTIGDNNSSLVYLPQKKILRFLITNILTWLLMGLVIMAAIWLPARKASSLAPAEALHYE